jgi:hypothetical protein
LGFFELLKSGEWTQVGERGGRVTSQDKKHFSQTTQEKWEIKVDNKQGKYVGVMKPSDGVLRENFAKPGRTKEKRQIIVAKI